MTKPAFASVAVAALLALPATCTWAQVKAYMGTLTLPSYEEGPPNPNPPFDEYATSRYNYPYTLRDNITSHRATHNFRAVFLENEYLKCSILPDLGGHIYTCIDKINNVPMFYANPSIKEAQIGMRGGWSAFGAEFNFPVSHSWTTISPVDFAYAANKDGSGTVTVSNIDRVYGMQWTVQIVLRPATTLLEEHVTLSNRDDVRHRFYWWSNAGVQVWDDSRVCYPMRYTAAHGFADIDRWPLDSSGVDFSLLKNQVHGPLSRFVYGSREPYMGIWNPHTDAGVAHYADYAELPGKKIWSWGADADAMDWRHALSDNDSAYMEVQGGLFRNQETYAFLEPRQTVHFSEYWMPLRGLGGLSRANLSGAASLSRSGSTLLTTLNVNRRFSGATIRILEGSTALQSAQQDLLPERTWKGSTSLPDPTQHYTLEVRDSAGKVILEQTEGKYDWTPDAEIKVGPQAPETLLPPAKRSDGDWLFAGHDDELNGRLLVAAADYEHGLAAFPHSQGLTIASGRLAVALLHYREAVSLLSEAQARDTPNPQIAYYLGLAYDGLNDLTHARAAFETSTRLPDMRAAAELRLGELYAREGDLSKATNWLRQSLASAPDDLRTAEELAAVLHANGAADEAHVLASTWYERFPTNYFLAEELGRPDIAHLAADPDRVLNVAAEYMRLGRFAPAVAVLSREYPATPPGEAEPGSVAPQNNALVAYYRAYCLEKAGEPATQDWDRASHASVRYIFPSGPASATVLQAALQHNAHDATALDLLGTLDFSVGLTGEAEALWTRAHDTKASLPALDASRGLAALYIDRDPARALEAFGQGIESDSTNQANYMGVDQAQSMLHQPPSQFVDAMSRYPDESKIPAKLVYELALHEAEANHYTAAEALFRNRFFPREENGTNVRQVWIEVEMLRLLASAKDGDCRSAIQGLEALTKPRPEMVFTRDGMEPQIATARVQLMTAFVYQQCQKPETAQAAFAQAAQDAALENTPWAYLAAKQRPGFDEQAWRGRLQNALTAVQQNADTHPLSMYAAAALEEELGDATAQETLQKVFLLPDQKLSYHLARLAAQGTVQP